MEENNVQEKNRVKIAVTALVTFLLLGVVAGAVLLFMPNRQVIENGEVVITYDEKETAADEATLRELLAHESNMIIEVTEDIMIDETISIQGGKKLTGKGTIAMELYVHPYQFMFEVAQGAKLELDGVTIDGNGSSNCVKVEKDAQLSLLSGKMTYGCPTVIETFGNVYIKGGSIADGIGTGVLAHNGANVYMTDGELHGCVDSGIEGGAGSYISISGQAVLHNNMEYFVYSKGTCDITGGTFRDGGLDLVYTSGVMNVKYTGDEENGMLEWYDIGGCAFIVGNGGDLNVERLHVSNVRNRVISTAAGQNITKVSNCLFENSTWDSVYARSEVQLNNVVINNAGASAIMVVESGNVKVDNVTVNSPAKDGIQNGGGVVTGSNFTVNQAGRIGVNSYKYNGVAGSVTLNNVTINGTKSNGLHSETSTLTVTKAKIKEVGSVGANAQKDGKLKLTNVEFENGKRGIQLYHGQLEGKNITIASPKEYGITCGLEGSGFNIEGLTVKECGTIAVNVFDGAIAEASKVTIVKPASRAGFVGNKGQLRLNNINVTDSSKTAFHNENATLNINGGSINGAGEHGVHTYKAGRTTLTDLKVNNSKNNNIRVVDKGSKCVLNNVSTSGGGRGLQIYTGGQIEGKNITIASPKEYGISCGDIGSSLAITNLKVADCGTTAMNVYDSAVATVTNGTITKAGKYGAYVGNKGKLTLNNNTFSETGQSALANENGTLNVKDGSVTQTGDHGVHTYKGGQTNLTDCKVQNSTNDNIRVNNENSKVVLKNVKTIGGKRGIQIYSGGKVVGNAVTITSPEENGVACGETGSEFNITDLTVKDCKKIAVNVYINSVGNVTEGTITNPGSHGANVDKGATLILNGIDITFDEKKTGKYEGVRLSRSASANLHDVTITNAPRHGVYIWRDTSSDDETTYGTNGVLTLTGQLNITSPKNRGIINDGGTVNGYVEKNPATVTVTTPGEYGVSTSNAGTTTIGELNVSGAKGYSSMTVNNANTVVTVYGGKIENSYKNGVNASEGTLNLYDFEITEFGKENKKDTTYDGVQAQKASTIKLTNVQITGGTNGIRIYDGGKIVGSKNVTISSPTKYGIVCSNEGSEFNIEGLTVENCGSDALNVYDKAVGAVTNKGAITNPATHGANVYQGATLTLNGVDITFDEKKTGNYEGVRLSRSASANLHNVTITNAPRHGVYIWRDTSSDDETTYGTNGVLTLTGQLNISSPKKRGIINDGGTVNGYVDGNPSTVTVTTPGEYGVSTSNAGTTIIGKLNVSGARGFSSMTVNNANTVVTIYGGKIENSYKNGVNASMGTLNLYNFEITGSNQSKGTYYDVYAEKNSTINLYNMTNVGSLSKGYGSYNASAGEKEGIINVQ